jgi:hypothetical protein
VIPLVVLTAYMGGEVDMGDVKEHQPSRVGGQRDRGVGGFILTGPRFEPGAPVEHPRHRRSVEVPWLEGDRLDAGGAEALPKVR